MSVVSVFNLGISNLTSVLNVLDHIQVKYDLVNDKEGVRNAKKLLLPGVGTFAAGMQAMQQLDLVEEIKNSVENKKIPIFGICLGMQLLFENSEESPNVSGFGFLKGAVVKIPESANYQIPRIGWAQSEVKNDFLGLKKGVCHDFYYIHDFHAKPQEEEIISITSEHNSITAAVNKSNIFGCQFHPEKSYLQGINLIREFCKI